MDKCRISLAQIPTQLANRLYVRQRLNVTHRAANLRNHHIVLPARPKQKNAAPYLIRNMWNDLNCLPQVLATPFLMDNAFIDLTTRHAVRLRGTLIQETLVVPKIQIRFRTIIRDVAFPMLVRVQRPRIYV